MEFMLYFAANHTEKEQPRFRSGRNRPRGAAAGGGGIQPSGAGPQLGSRSDPKLPATATRPIQCVHNGDGAKCVEENRRIEKEELLADV
jgi:hypothetical protein